MSENYEEDAKKVALAMGDSSLADELVEEHDATKIADYLCAERNRQGLSQRDVARRMGVSASKICRIEDSYDRDLSYSDIISYGKALGVEPSISFTLQTLSDKERSEGLVYEIAKLLEKLKAFLPDQAAGISAIEDFSGRVLFPVLQRYHTT